MHLRPFRTEEIDLSVATAIATAMKSARAGKPGDRSEVDRLYAVAITDLEKAFAVFTEYAVDGHRVDNLVPALAPPAAQETAAAILAAIRLAYSCKPQDGGRLKSPAGSPLDPVYNTVLPMLQTAFAWFVTYICPDYKEAGDVDQA